jgi:hypothetical protein
MPDYLRTWLKKYDLNLAAHHGRNGSRPCRNVRIVSVRRAGGTVCAVGVDLFGLCPDRLTGAENLDLGGLNGRSGGSDRK